MRYAKSQVFQFVKVSHSSEGRKWEFWLALVHMRQSQVWSTGPSMLHSFCTKYARVAAKSVFSLSTSRTNMLPPSKKWISLFHPWWRRMVEGVKVFLPSFTTPDDRISFIASGGRGSAETSELPFLVGSHELAKRRPRTDERGRSEP